MGFQDELEHRARQYTQRNGLRLGQELGRGVHGIVFVTESQPENGPLAARSAIKVHRREPDYQRERDVYLRLKELGLTAIRGCRVPQLLAYDDSLGLLEMTVVSRPFVLDFAGAYLDEPPDFSEEVMADCARRKRSNSARAGRKFRRFSGFSKVTTSSCWM